MLRSRADVWLQFLVHGIASFFNNLRIIVKCKGFHSCKTLLPFRLAWLRLNLQNAETFLKSTFSEDNFSTELISIW